MILRQDFKQGTVDDSPLSSGATTLNSTELSEIQAITGGSADFQKLILDPAGINGDPEIVYVTSHVASATSATIQRGMEGTSAREHPQDTVWKHGPTARDFGLQIGEMKMFLGAIAPEFWVFARGQELSRTTYAKLFAAIGTTFGAGDGSTTFNVPDLQGIFPVGAAGTAGDYDLGDTGGEETHTLISDEMPAHTHTGPSHTHGAGSLSAASGGSHNHDAYHQSGVTVSIPSGSFYSLRGSHATKDPTDSGGSHTHTVSGTTGSGGTGATGSTGSGDPHENRPPFLAVNYIIFAGV